ncbi:MAG: hypothetical protein WDO19_10150 [Bacteroidota bacterium]
MRKIVLIFITTFFLANSIHAQQKATWKEMEDFHSVMATTFHPAEEGNLKPIKTRSGEMLDKATAWKNADAPEGYNKKAVKSNLKKLVKGAKEIDKMVKENAADTELVARLSKLHDIFHEIMEKCQDEGHEH